MTAQESSLGLQFDKCVYYRQPPLTSAWRESCVRHWTMKVVSASEDGLLSNSSLQMTLLLMQKRKKRLTFC